MAFNPEHDQCPITCQEYIHPPGGYLHHRSFPDQFLSDAVFLIWSDLNSPLSSLIFLWASLLMQPVHKVVS